MVRPFPAKKKHWASEAQGLSSEAMKGNPLTTVILRVDVSKSTNNRTVDRTEAGHEKGSNDFCYLIVAHELLSTVGENSNVRRATVVQNLRHNTLQDGVPKESRLLAGTH